MKILQVTLKSTELFYPMNWWIFILRLVVASAVLISAFVSLTITLVLNVYLNRPQAQHGWLYRITEPFFTGMENGYRKTLKQFVRRRGIAWYIVLACLLITYFIGRNL